MYMYTTKPGAIVEKMFFYSPTQKTRRSIKPLYKFNEHLDIVSRL
jgi:hypothetical protein